jgi:hypothetical protein
VPGRPPRDVEGVGGGELLLVDVGCTPRPAQVRLAAANCTW